MKVRAKFTVTKVADLGDWNGKRQEIMRPEETPGGTTQYVSTGIPVREITLSAVFDNGIAAENKSFAEATPSGTITFLLNNAACAEAFKPGQNYYVDFTPVEK